MNAFAHHVPEDGAVIIFYAPHIGVTKDGTIGEIGRIGQSVTRRVVELLKEHWENSLRDGSLKEMLLHWTFR